MLLRGKKHGSGLLAIEDLDIEVLDFIRRGTFVTLMRTLGLIDMKAQETLSTFDEISAVVQSQETDFFSAAKSIKVKVTTPMARLVVTNAIYSWKEGGAESVIPMQVMLRSDWKEVVSPENGFVSALLGEIVDALHDLTMLGYYADHGEIEHSYVKPWLITCRQLLRL